MDKPRVRLIEHWEPVPVDGFEDYEVSSFGQVRSLDRVVLYSDGRKRFFSGKILALDDSNLNGYIQVKLCRGSEGRQGFEVHTLVLLAHVGPRPDGMEACHDNGIKRDNYAWNLRWDTPSNNQKDRQKHGTFKPFGKRGEEQHLSKLTEEIVKECRRRYAAGETQQSLADEFDVAQTSMSALLLRKTWKHVI